MMDSLKDDDVRVNVKSLISTFSDTKLSGNSSGSKDKAKGSAPSGCWSVKSKEPPLLFKDQQSAPSGCWSVKSKEPPLLFKDQQSAGPDDNYFEYKSDLSSVDNGHVNFEKKINLPYGMPQPWGGHVMCTMNVQRSKIPSAAYPVPRPDRRAPDDNRAKGNRAKSSLESQRTNQGRDFPSHHNVCRDYLKTNFSSESSGYSSSETSGSRDSQHDERPVLYGDIKEVICDICLKLPAVKTCLTCAISYCDADIRQHYTVEALQRHALTDVRDEIEEKRCRHYEKSLDFFCKTDQMTICSICAQITSHRGHDIIPQSHVKISKPKTPETGFSLPVVPPPGKIEFLSVKRNSVVLKWGSPKGLEGPKRFRVKWRSLGGEVEKCLVIKELHTIEINNLQLGQQYLFSVATEDQDGNLSEWVTESVFTVVPAPQHLTKGYSEATAFSLTWTKGESMEGIPHQFLLTITSPGKEQQAIHTEECYKIFSDLKPDTEYKITVETVLNNQYSEKVSTTIHTEPCLRKVLSKMGLEDYYDNKLTLSSVLEINQNDTSENKLETANSLPEAFLKKLMILNKNARSVRSHDVDRDKNNAINPLDLITALFLCSDGFLQQDIVLKMVLCQFALPLLLPNHETRKITMMLWTMRDIVRAFSPSIQAFRKRSCEERIVLSDIPLVSFVRLGRTSLSKSQMLNKLFSNTRQCHDTFYHHNMECGDVPRRISEGLVEISWYLPCGKKTVDKFTEPLAVANLRGDIKAFDKQFSFLCRTSAAIYIFCDESEADYFKNLEGKDVKANVNLISSMHGKTTLKMMTMKPSLKTTNVTGKKNTDEELIKALQESISKMLENCPNKVSVENLADAARQCGILVDEDSDECQSALKNASKITKQVTNASEFKDKKLKGKQLRFEMTAAMSSFLHGVVTSETQCYYFLKWLEMDLDNKSRNQLSDLRDRYKDVSQKFPQDAEKIAEIDKQISVCSLRLDHFFRECGQLYECASDLPELSRQRKTMEKLPALCARMLLDGFPLELVDGDTANIPMKWITEVLTELHNIMQSNSKLKVITIIGAENSGKSTLLNTMFGVRFAVSKGTCTRGAFIQLINVNKDVREELGCDCLLIIDTEGLKPNQMVQDDYSHECDKEVVSLAVALSDATIVSVSRDNSSEKDILEMVLHASCSRLKYVGTKPLCHFVHSNMSDMPAAERRSSTYLVEQLNEMIRKDTQMKKDKITKISDVMQFDPDTCSWHIPPVWHGTPPMAPFSVDYSETAHALKKRLIGDLRKCQKRGDLTDFIRTVEHFWKTP
ncbi:up-regulator of cell proliferation-like isoform X5 [Dicentrarchus labrax]|uniref:up-regulator of cell proliferation-like isoform X5 n=1 Tax=Dicentrarchus labrax TaxID=13489 RepID=UPI0021F5676B|nr:up-regulator of cell proliferation-like isoform X5 [Dicentrarchus labrax]